MRARAVTFATLKSLLCIYCSKWRILCQERVCDACSNESSSSSSSSPKSNLLWSSALLSSLLPRMSSVCVSRVRSALFNLFASGLARCLGVLIVVLMTFGTSCSEERSSL